MPKYDAFISHANEDKDEFVRPLVARLKRKGYKIWFDEFTLSVGDNLRESIDYGLNNSKYGIIVLSHSFFLKNWPKYELNGLVTLDVDNPGIILPIWHKINKDEIVKFSPSLANKIALNTSHLTLQEIVSKLEERIGETKYYLDSNMKLKKSPKKGSINNSDRKRGFHVVLSDQADKIINKNDTIIRTRKIVQPFDKPLSEFPFHHWQDSKGEIELIRVNVLEEQSGKIVNHKIRIEKNDGHKFILRCLFDININTPLNILFEIRTTNYYPNLFTIGNGYTEIESRYPIDVFRYNFYMPNNENYKNMSLLINEKKIAIFESANELSAIYKETNVKAGDKFKFTIINNDI